MRELFEKNHICAIMRNIPGEIALDYARAAYSGGIRMFEVAMNTADGPRQIELLRNGLGSDSYVGAGTVIDETRCRDAHAAGASFFLTPSVSVTTFEYCRKHQIPLLPGVLTPSDVGICLEYGYDVMKLFPAGEMPAGYIKSLKGPFDQTDYVAVGGVSPDNYRQYLAGGYIGVGIGSNLIPSEYIKNRMWREATEHIGDSLR